MGDMSREGGHLAAGIDLSQFFQVFFEEAGENLENMEQMLLALDVGNADDETLNAIFRCAHSVKGGAATFGFAVWIDHFGGQLPHALSLVGLLLLIPAGLWALRMRWTPAEVAAE